MNFFKKAGALIISAVICAVSVSCASSSNVYNPRDFYTKAGELTISPYFAYYNNGKQVEGLDEIDPEMAEEGPLDDGAFNIYFALSNNSPYDRKITEIMVDFIKNKENYDIVEASEFSMDDETYIGSGQTLIIPCVFEKDFVKLEAKLQSLSAKASVSYEGCVIDGNDPDTIDNSLTASVKELKFTSTDGIEGSFSIKNNFKEKKNIKKISFMLYTDENAAITKDKVEMNINSEIEAGEQITLRFAVLPGNVSDDIKESKLFNSVKIIISEE